MKFKLGQAVRIMREHRHQARYAGLRGIITECNPNIAVHGLLYNEYGVTVDVPKMYAKRIPALRAFKRRTLFFFEEELQKV